MDWHVFLEPMSEGDPTWGAMLLSGLGWTVAVAILAWIMAFVLGSLIGIARTAERRWLVALSGAYVELFRNIPLLVQFFVWYFVVPGLIPPVKTLVLMFDPITQQFATAVICLGFFTAARIAEQVRSGIQALSRGQRNAGYALGLTPLQTYRYVLLPMAYRMIMPPLTSELMNLIKNTAVAYSIGLVELFFRTREMGETTFRYFEAFAAATVLYLLIALAANRLMVWIEKRLTIPGQATGGRHV